jgi:hypothetical protein
VATKKRQTGKVLARDAEGKEYSVITVTTFLDAPGLGSARKELVVSHEFFTTVEEDGIRISKSVNRIDKGIYEIAGTGIELRSDAPDAP